MLFELRKKGREDVSLGNIWAGSRQYIAGITALRGMREFVEEQGKPVGHRSTIKVELNKICHC